MNSRFWAWKDFKLILPGFLILRIFTGQNMIEMALKLEESEGQRTELILTYGLDSFNDFIEDLREINLKVEKKGDFRGKALKYDFSSGRRIELSLYFNKDEFLKFYKFLEDCYKEIKEQEFGFKILMKKEGNK